MIEILLLRVIHVVGGMYWVGSALFGTFFLMPALAGAGPAAGSVMAGLRERGMLMVAPIVALLTILSGLRLMWLTSAGFAPAYFTTPRGATFAASGAAAVLAFLLGMVVLRPAMARMGVLGAELARLPDDAARAETAMALGRVRRRSEVTGHFVAALLLVSAVGMAVARYVMW